MNKLIFLIIMLLCTDLAQAQVTQKWWRSIPGGANDVEIDGAGNIYACGCGYDHNVDFVVLKYTASEGFILWKRVISGTDSSVSEQATSLVLDAYANVYVTGYVWRGEKAGLDYVTVKYDSSGAEQWRKYYNSPIHVGDDRAFDIGLDNAGNVFVTGESEGEGHVYDYATVKYAPDGTQLWAQRYDGPAHGEDIAISLSVDGWGNVAVTGTSMGSGTNNDIATLKYWSSGTLNWIKRYNGDANGNDGAEEIDVDALGYVYVTGSSEGDDSYDITTIKYSPNGTQYWAKKYDRDGASAEWGKDVKVDLSGNIYVTGYSNFPGGLTDMVTLKYNMAGVQQWARIYNAPENKVDVAKRMALDAFGNVYITGFSSWGSSTNDYDYITIKYNSDGLKRWEIKYNGPANYQDNADAIAVRDSVIVVTGGSRGFDYKFNLTTVKYVQTVFHASVGRKLAEMIYEVSNLVSWGNLTAGNGNALNAKLNAAIQKVNQGNNNAAINQLSAFNNQVDAFVRTGKLVPEFGETLTAETDEIIQELNRDFCLYNEAPLSYMLTQNYPNPFNPVTVINFSLPVKKFVILAVYDVLGNEIKVLVNEIMEAGQHDISFNASGLSSGVYFYRLEAGEFKDVKKMILVK